MKIPAGGDTPPEAATMNGVASTTQEKTSIGIREAGVEVGDAHKDIFGVRVRSALSETPGEAITYNLTCHTIPNS